MKSKLSVILLGTLIFLLGGVAGGVSYYIYCEKIQTKALAPRTIPKVDDVVEGMARVLKLDVQQKEQVKTIISESRNRYRELSRQFRPEYEKIVKDSDSRIRALLRDDQKPLFEEFLKKLKSRPANASSASK